MIYNMEFKGEAIKKMYMLPINVSSMYLCKFVILTVLLLIAVLIQNLALLKIGITDLPVGTFNLNALIVFTGYSFITSMPVFSFMLLISSRFENMWISLGIGVGGFSSGMAIANSKFILFMVHPFVLMLKPAVALNASPNPTVIIFSLIETFAFLGVGLWLTKNHHYE